MNESSVVLTPIPQADGNVKNWPVVVLRALPPYDDLLVCGVSTQLQQHVRNFDELIASVGRRLLGKRPEGGFAYPARLSGSFTAAACSRVYRVGVAGTP